MQIRAHLRIAEANQVGTTAEVLTAGGARLRFAQETFKIRLFKQKSLSCRNFADNIPKISSKIRPTCIQRSVDTTPQAR